MVREISFENLIILDFDLRADKHKIKPSAGMESRRSELNPGVVQFIGILEMCLFYQVVQFLDDTFVQYGNATFTNGVNNYTEVDLGTQINTSRTWLYFTNDATTVGLVQVSVKGNVLNSTASLTQTETI